jgi:protein tyrosine phosphatase
MLKRQKNARTGREGTPMEIDAGNGDWLNKSDQDLIEKTVEEFRLQRLSMVQSLRQFVLCYESVLEWLNEQHVQTKTA